MQLQKIIDTSCKSLIFAVFIDETLLIKLHLNHEKLNQI